MRERDEKGREQIQPKKRGRKGVEREFVKMEQRGMREILSMENEKPR